MQTHTTVHCYFSLFVSFISFYLYFSPFHQTIRNSSVHRLEEIKEKFTNISTSFECATNVAMIQRMTSFHAVQSFSVLAIIRDTTFKIKMDSHHVRKRDRDRTKSKCGVYRAILVSTMCLWHTFSALRCTV